MDKEKLALGFLRLLGIFVAFATVVMLLILMIQVMRVLL